MESFNFIEKLPFIGEERIEFKIYTPEVGDNKKNIIEGQFYCYKITNRESVASCVRPVMARLRLDGIPAAPDVPWCLTAGCNEPERRT